MGRACRVKERSDWHRICKTSVLAFPYTGSPAHAVDALDFRRRSPETNYDL